MTATVMPSGALFQSTLSMRRATDTARIVEKPTRISIHALHEESDSTNACRSSSSVHISIHALHEESDPIEAKAKCPSDYISIHALHEESDACWSPEPDSSRQISIHALHEESDVTSSATRSACSIFQSTLSMRRATRRTIVLSERQGISIHALHEESDNLNIITRIIRTYFNPRSP